MDDQLVVILLASAVWLWCWFGTAKMFHHAMCGTVGGVVFAGIVLWSLRNTRARTLGALLLFGCAAPILATGSGIGVGIWAIGGLFAYARAANSQAWMILGAALLQITGVGASLWIGMWANERYQRILVAVHRALPVALAALGTAHSDTRGVAGTAAKTWALLYALFFCYTLYRNRKSRQRRRFEQQTRHNTARALANLRQQLQQLSMEELGRLSIMARNHPTNFQSVCAFIGGEDAPYTPQ